MRIGFVGDILSSMYTDKVTVKRCKSTTNADGTTKTALNPTPVLEDVACRISFEKNDGTSTNDSSYPVFILVKIFTASNIDIKKGDTLVASKLDDDGNVIAVYTGIANLPLQYVSHQEVMFQQDGVA